MKNTVASHKFSLKITLIGLVLAALMTRASFWQYSRYLEKSKLVKSYELNEDSPAREFPLLEDRISNYEPLVYRKVTLSGEYDFDNQLLISNRKDESGPGFWLLSPFKIDHSEKRILVCRGFIPFADRDPKNWSKYNTVQNLRIRAVLQQTQKQKFFFVPAQAKSSNTRIWLFPDLSQIQQSLPYPIYQSIYLQRLSEPEDPKFPKQAVSVRVPPSTHFGYTIEWAVLAFLTLAATIALQAFPSLQSRFNKNHRAQELREK